MGAGKIKSVLIRYPAILLAIFISFNLSGQTKVESRQAPITISLSNGVLSLEVHDQSLIKVIKQIGDLADFEVIVVDESIRFPRISASYTEAPVEVVIQRLLEDTNNVIYLHPNKKRAENHVISQIWLVGLSSDDTSGIQLVSDTNPEIFEMKSLNDAVVEQINDNGTLSEHEKNRVLNGLIGILLSTDDPIIRSRAAISLGNFKDSKAVSVLEQTLASTESMVRSQALYALGEIGGDQATMVLGKYLLNSDANLNERTEAARILGGFNSEKAQYYLDLASKNADQKIRMAVNENLAHDDENESKKNHQANTDENDQ